MGGPQCRLSILRHTNVPNYYFGHFHINFKVAQCHLSNLRNTLCHVGNIFSHVDSLHVTFRF